MLTAFDAGAGGVVAQGSDLTASRNGSIDPAVTNESRFMRLNSCLGEFAQLATPIAQRIIDDLHLPDAEKHFRPAQDVGGIAGGSKYKAEGIVKFHIHSFIPGDLEHRFLSLVGLLVFQGGDG